MLANEAASKLVMRLSDISRVSIAVMLSKNPDANPLIRLRLRKLGNRSELRRMRQRIPNRCERLGFPRNVPVGIALIPFPDKLNTLNCEREANMSSSIVEMRLPSRALKTK